MPCLENIANNPTFIVSLTAELILLALHVSILACILRQRRKGNAAFRSGFFTIYVMQSFVDIFQFVTDLTLYRLPPMGCMSEYVFYGNISFILATYAISIQYAAHAAIGVNRFLVLSDAWTQRKERVAVIAVLLVSVPTAALRVFGRTRLIETSKPGLYSLIRDIPWFTPAAQILFNSAMSLVSIAFELRALARYRELTVAARERYRNDFLLLIYALTQFSIQLVCMVFYGLYSFGALIGDFRMMSVGNSIMIPSALALCLTPPLCLLSTR